MRESPISELEGALRALVGAEHVLAVCSGTAAYMTALLTLSPRPRAEVLLSAYTWPQLAAVPEVLGLKVGFVDCDPQGRMCPDSLASRLGPRTGAVVVCHLFGNPVDARRIAEVAGRAGVPVIEDCSQSLLALQGGRMVGRWGTLAFASLGPTKLLSAGEGGVLWTPHTHLHDLAFGRSQHPSRAPNERQATACAWDGLSLRMHPEGAAQALRSLATVKERAVRLQQGYRLLRELLDGVPGIRLLTPLPDAVPVWQHAPVLVEPWLARRIGRVCSKTQPAYLVTRSRRAPNAARFARRVRYLTTGRRWDDVATASLEGLAAIVRAAAQCGG